MAGFEKLLQIRAENAKAAEEEAKRVDAEVASDPRGTGVREGVPVGMWRALQR